MAEKRVVWPALFLLLTGALLGAVTLHITMRYFVFRSFPPPPRSPEQAIMQRLGSELNLDQKQKEALLPIIRDTKERMEKLRQENLPRMEAIIDESSKKADVFLAEQQRQQLQQLTDRVKKHLQASPAARHRHHPRGIFSFSFGPPDAPPPDHHPGPQPMDEGN